MEEDSKTSLINPPMWRMISLGVKILDKLSPYYTAVGKKFEKLLKDLGFDINQE